MFCSSQQTFDSTYSGSFNVQVTVTFPYSLTGIPTQDIAIGIIGLDSDIATDQFTLAFHDIASSSSGFHIKILNNRGQDLAFVMFNYLVVDPSFSYPFVIYNYEDVNHFRFSILLLMHRSDEFSLTMPLASMEHHFQTLRTYS